MLEVRIAFGKEDQVMPVVDGGAPTGGRGIEQVTTPKLITEVRDLIATIVASNVNRTAVKNSVYESDNFHVDATPLGGKPSRCKVDIQKKMGTKNTVACAILAMSVSSDADVRLALTNSFGNQHIWNVT
jgi:hypothetical protein